ncbi:unnamed protein product [Phaeothamnion confervicola]
MLLQHCARRVWARAWRLRQRVLRAASYEYAPPLQIRALSRSSSPTASSAVTLVKKDRNNNVVPCATRSDPTLLPTAVACISFYLLGWSPMFWTVGKGMLAGTPPPLPALASGDLWAEIGLRQLTLAQTAVVAAQKLRTSPTFKRIISPPVLGCIAGTVVGMCAPARALLVEPRAIFSSVFESLEALGAAYLLTAILILAGSLAHPDSKVAAGPPGSVGGGGSAFPKVER